MTDKVKVYWELEKEFKLPNYYAIRYLFPIDDTTIVCYDPYGFVNDVPTRLDSVLIIKIVNSKLTYRDPIGSEKQDWLNRIGAKKAVE